MVVEMTFKGLDESQKSVYKKYALRKAQAISLVNASIIITEQNGIITNAKITLGSVAPVIIHAKKAESFLVGKKLSAEVVKQASEFVGEDISPISDIRSSADYRQKISSILVKRGLTDLLNNTRSIVPESPVLLWGTSKPYKSISGLSLKQFDHTSQIETTINGKKFILQNHPNQSLLHLIREDAKLTGTKEGCGEGECGACTVFMDGVAVMSCLVPSQRADQAEIVTIEGLSDGDVLHPVQQAFVNEGAVQCGYCTPGFVMSAVKLFEEKSKPDLEEIKMAITGNLCRCTGYYKIVKAIESVVESGDADA
jgi:carbon-monoxide dehydrogenase medium subunit